jgi:Flp pilus assembly protein TadD
MILRLPASLLRIGVVVLLFTAAGAYAKDLHINLPKRAKPTPVQQLNRDGVKAVENHDYDKAKRLFYKAYLLDPDDPFTLNNLGYIAEMGGDIDRAQRYYDLASRQRSDATVDASNNESIKGKPVGKVAGNATGPGMQINRMNVAAIGLLRKDRAPEADIILQRALALDPRNPFTLNNMGFAKEKEGELDAALSFYTAAASLGSTEPVVATINKDWRGKPISNIANENANNLRRDMNKPQTLATRVARLNLQGVSAANRNDRRAARSCFEQAYSLDPHDAFTLNNMGYVSEMDGDRETANFYYEKAAEARRNQSRVDVATRSDMEGRKIRDVANISDDKVAARMEQDREARAQQGGPIELKRRDNTPVVKPDNSPPPAPNP